VAAVNARADLKAWRGMRSRYIVKMSLGGVGMRGIAKLFFGGDEGRVLDLLAGHDDGFELAERVRRSGEWCGSTPGRGSANRAADADRERRRPGAVTPRDFCG
jgi:hypothetical protein